MTDPFFFDDGDELRVISFMRKYPLQGQASSYTIPKKHRYTLHALEAAYNSIHIRHIHMGPKLNTTTVIHKKDCAVT